jgi:large subunit ribosomal protein L7/L12
MADLNAMVERLDALSKPDSNELVSLLEEKWHVNARPASLVSEGPVVEEAPPEQTEFDVLLQSYGNTKVKVVQVVRGIVSLGLKEAMALVNQAPILIKSGISRSAADDMKRQIEEVGGIVDVH